MALLGLLALLFLLSRALSQHLGILIYKLTGHDHEWTVRIMAFLFMPGTVVHEFAHAAVASGLGVYVGDIDLLPKVEGKYVKLGTVQIAQTDPFRRFFIGVAPIVLGLVVIFLILFLFQKFEPEFAWWGIVFGYYIIFEIGNGMFSSRRDMEGAVELLIALIVVAGVLYLLGVRFSLDWLQNFIISASSFFEFASWAIAKIVALDILLIIIAGATSKFLVGRIRYN